VTDLLIAVSLGAGPVVLLLLALLSLDSYKLVRLPAVARWLLLGAGVAVVCLAVNSALRDALGMARRDYAHWLSPLVEEGAKAAIVLWMVRRHRVAFLVDAAIHGFAVGTGFAVIENLVYWQSHTAASVGVWIARGAGTALMHGGATALVALAAVSTPPKRRNAAALVAALLPAVLVHGLYNRFLLSPVLSAALIVLVLPLLLVLAFRRGERAFAEWLNLGFDADTEMLELILSGNVSGSPVGTYLEALRHRFEGPIVADLLNWLRLHLELSLAAKGLLLMREAGFAPEPDPETMSKLDELAWLENSIGPTGMLAMAPFLRHSSRETWQRSLLKG
jgi:RsiW-degrading membrane proteinase PrsW (M82 family)